MKLTLLLALVVLTLISLAGVREDTPVRAKPGVLAAPVALGRVDGIPPRPSATPTRASRQRHSEPPSRLDQLDWKALRQCESSGNYKADTGNGYYGAYQFDLSTWRSVGGSGNPAHATPAEQDYRALVLYSRRGAQPWPVCGRRLQ